MMERKYIKGAIILFVALVLVVGGAWYGLVVKGKDASYTNASVQDIGKIGDRAAGGNAPASAPRKIPALTATGTQIGGSYSMVDQDGKPVTDETYHGHYLLYFFGFTNCPSVCPTEMSKITLALSIMGKKADNIKPVFVTTDPDRDTPAVVKEYISHFHPYFVGLTGTQDQVTHMEKLFKVYAAKVDTGDPDNYQVDHSAYSYFFDTDGHFVDVFSADTSAQDMADRLLDIVAPSSK